MTAKTLFRAVFLGPPGAGKGTQAIQLARTLAAAHLSTGDMLRRHVAQGTELGRRAESAMVAGQLVPDDLIIAMVEDRLQSDLANSAWILDGFPRTVTQAEALDRSLGDSGLRLTHVVFFSVDRAELMMRLTGRRTCSSCGAIWNVTSNPTKNLDVCDLCDGRLTHRSDDRPESVERRLAEYDKSTQPLLTFYRRSGCLREVDASRPVAEIGQEIKSILQGSVR